jgi:hypothetical protein
MRPRLLMPILLIIFGCQNKVHISGIIVDKTTKRPLDNVQIRTLIEANKSGMHFIETKSKKGRFQLHYSSNTVRSNEITIELSKEGYLSNLYSCFQDRPNDTLYMVRKY